MTVSKTTTQEKARQYCLDIGYSPVGSESMGPWIAAFADSLTAELQKENAWLDKALREAMVLCGTVRLAFWPTLGKEMREQVEKVEELGFAALAIPPKGGAVQKGLSKEKACE